LPQEKVWNIAMGIAGALLVLAIGKFAASRKAAAAHT
jgi:hypothetical protein